jgi:GT2 family glycosyltransferase/glycosyltransferase involved in cell wall biosynthesis
VFWRLKTDGDNYRTGRTSLVHDDPGKSTTRFARLLHSLAMHRASRDDTTAYAMAKAMGHLGNGELAAALSLLNYARRRTPSDGAIDLAMAVVQLALGDRLAAEPLEALSQRTDWRDLWMALIVVRLRFGEVERAAGHLQDMLGRLAVSRSEPDIELASTVSRLTDADGWCGLDSAGRLITSTGRKSLRGLVLRMDGTEVLLGERRNFHKVNELRLPKGWHSAARLDVHLDGRALIGSPIDIQRISRIEGFVETASTSSGIRGWCRFPADRERVPTITVTSLADPRQRLSIRAGSTEHRAIGGDEFAVLHNFTLAADMIDFLLGDVVRVTGPRGRALYGSPIWTSANKVSRRAARSAVAQCSASFSKRRTARAPRLSRQVSRRQEPPRPVDVVIPVYSGRDATLDCIASVCAHRDTGERIIVIADGSPERELVAALAALADQGAIILQAEAVNRGFPGAANIGLRLAVGHDVVLLNADTMVTPRWLTGLRAAVYSAPDIGTATPLSNDATIFSYPRRDGPNPCPDAASAADLAALAADVNRAEVIDVPTGHGFCLYMRAECLAETGPLREDLFAQGYGEENDFCMRAHHLGWRHVAVPSVFVAHHGAGSFNAARDDLMRRNLENVNRLHTGYDQMIARWQSQDPLAESRRRIDLARLRNRTQRGDAVLLVTHDRDGGIRRHVAERLDAIGRTSRCVILLRPGTKVAGAGPATSVVRLGTGFQDEFPNLIFRMPDEQASLLSCLQEYGVGEIEVHSLIGHSDSVVDLILALRAPVDLRIHDYSWFCPRISLTGGDHRYCGEPAIAACRDCVADSGSTFDEPVSPDQLVSRTRRLIEAARSIIAPSEDSARRIVSRFGREVVIGEWEQTRRFALHATHEAASQSRPVRICVVGAISHEKGYGNLLQCARLVAAGDVPIEFVVVGYTCDDRSLLDTNVVRITGRYTESEVVVLIREQQADFAWLPSVGPETWCYTLTRIWEAGLHAVVHDIGAQAERVRATGGGLVVPLNLPLDRLLALFLGAHPGKALRAPFPETGSPAGWPAGRALAGSIETMVGSWGSNG